MNVFAKQLIKRSSQLVYEDKAILVVNKPSGLICQSDNTSSHKNAFDSLLLETKKNLDLPVEPLQVHRLDKFTTGALLLAKSKVHARAISQQFQAHTIKKTYLAVVRGGGKSFPEAAGYGSVRVPLLVKDGKVSLDEAKGSHALTDWELLGSSDKVPLSLVKLTLHSGIKHQLRAHLALGLNAPILGDTIYSHTLPKQEILQFLPQGTTVTSSQGKTHRIFLHAAQISLLRYRSGGPQKRFRLGVTVPVPSEFLAMCKNTGLFNCLSREYIEGGLEIDGESVPPQTVAEMDGVKGQWFM